MLSNPSSPRRYATSFSVSLITIAVVLAAALTVFAQTTISTGSIQGTVTDPSGAVVSGATVKITNKATGQGISTTTSSAGTYTSGALLPGEYVVRVEGQGFKTSELPVTVQVGVTSAGNVKLNVGEASQVVEVQAAQLQVNTEQATVQGVLNAQQIDNLPVNGRNFLDLAQLEPGVQIQDGGNFDPTKNGFSSISFGGRFGRTARIEVDGIDISDETVGTTTQNVAYGAIQEFQIGQSSLDLSTELTSSGSVNVVTRSGTNKVHGEGFYLFREDPFAARLPGGQKTPFQRNEFGGRLGGPIIKDKLFFFMDAERTKQDLVSPVLSKGGFPSGSFISPFRDNQLVGRLDWQVRPSNYRVFYRFTYEQNKNVTGFVPNSFQPFANVDHTPVHAGGLDFTTGSYTHSIRAGYTKFRNAITDAVTGTSIFNPAPGIELAIGADPTCTTANTDAFCSGNNFLAPQQTYQTDHQVKYDGSKTYKNHVLRYGVGYNHLQGGGFAKFLGLAPAVNAQIADCAPLPTCNPVDPLTYPANNVILGNGQGFSSEKPAFNLPGGGLGPDNRFSWYIGDSWKVKPNFTVTAGVRYVRDTGRTDSDIGPIPCSELNSAFAGTVTCTTSILDLWGPGLGARVHQPNKNFAPQLGIAWDPSKSGKTVIRAGVGLFYENSIWNNNLFNRPPRLQKGLFLVTPAVCPNAAGTFTFPDGSVHPTPFCGQPIGSVFQDIVAFQAAYQAAVVSTGAGVNGGFIGNTLASGTFATGTNMFAPNYQTPRSVQMNLGIQKEIRHGMVASVDYLRNVATHTMLTVDVNHVGDARFLNVNNALAAITTTVKPFGCPAASSAGGGPNGSQTAINCYLGPSGPANASIADFSPNGLDSGDVVCSGGPCPNAAFPGINPNLGTNQMLFPVGRSVYNGLQASLKQTLTSPLPGFKAMNLQVSYSFSRYVSTARDGDFINFAEDYKGPTHFIGPNALDRTHQVSFGGTFDLPFYLRLSVISHFYSPLPGNLRLPDSSIFVSDVTGDGTADGTSVSNGGNGDLVPGTKLGAFGRDISTSGLNKLISNYNANFAGQPTPAGQALLTANLFTQSQLASLGAVQQPLASPPPGEAGLGWLKAFDLKVSWPYKVREYLTIEPSVGIFNLFNFANFDSPNNSLLQALDGSPGSPNGTINNAARPDRSGIGSGVFGLGSPRVVEFGLKIDF